MTDALEYSQLGSSVWAFSTRRTLGRDRQRLCQMLSIDDAHLIIPHQTHGVSVCHVDSALLAMNESQRKETLEGIDAVITNLPRVCIGVSTADCIPVLLYDEAHHAVAAIHAGWKGTVRRIVQLTVQQMTTTFGSNPSDLRAVIGPGISMKNFEVGDEVYEAFSEAGFSMEQIACRYEKWHIDLPACNALQLTDLGVPEANIHIEPICTYDNTHQFFSARVEQKGDIKCGRNFNAIMLRT